MTPRLMRPVPGFQIFDSAKAKEFHGGFPGFKVDFARRFEPGLPLFMQISKGDVGLHLSEHHGDCRPGARMVNETADLAAYHADLWSLKCRHARPGLVDQPCATTAKTIADPFYTHIEFSDRRTGNITA